MGVKLSWRLSSQPLSSIREKWQMARPPSRTMGDIVATLEICSLSLMGNVIKSDIATNQMNARYGRAKGTPAVGLDFKAEDTISDPMQAQGWLVLFLKRATL
ncbi:uncharacterized protein N7482_001558 [Penicillium canariense]|uniref:Uncharacterized protein n=1 Tax=Penicillium canariense TaxID=189055 RepID=A0A9W9IHD9_9EURO|nr:uncharacterized protein N7482_001558 [Penicillium canariense]KAJ5175681.1 hypothetical protein N7482_001558 [Penicillium canariense]